MTTIALVLSCTDDSKDPLQLKNVKKGTLLALRDLSGDEVFPSIVDGTEKMTVTAEFLAEDVSTLESMTPGLPAVCTKLVGIFPVIG